jgi:acetoin utilization deacetylase AcuC-like enzyme
MEAAVRLANIHCQGKLLIVLEGGYQPAALARCVADAIEILDAPDPSPRPSGSGLH